MRRESGVQSGCGVSIPPSRSLPLAAAGRVALISFGFSYSARTPVEAWSDHVRQVWGNQPRVTWYQVPMIGGLGRLAKPFITGGMKRATAPAEYGHSVAVFGGVGAWKQRLAVTDDKVAYLVLVDEAGVVRWLIPGRSIRTALRNWSRLPATAPR